MSTENTHAKSIVEGMFGVFGQKTDTVKFKGDDNAGSVFFKPSPKDSPNQIFRGVVKFLPNLHNIENPKVTTITYWINEVGGQGFRYTSPKSISKTENCVVANEYWRLKESKDATEKALIKNIQYSSNTYVLVQIIKDLTTPANDGKIMLWNLPVAIIKKIDAQMYPSKEDIDAGEVENNVFDPINGFAMNLKIGIKTVANEKTGKTDEFRDYDECKFNDKLKTTIILSGESTQAVLSEDSTILRQQQEAMLQTILAGPNLEDYSYKTPTPAQVERVANALKNLTGIEIQSNSPVQPESAPVQPPTESTSNQTATPVQPESAPVQSTAESTSTHTAEPVQTATTVQTEASTETKTLSAEEQILVDLGLND